jgi:hypothetical protein
MLVATDLLRSDRLTRDSTVSSCNHLKNLDNLVAGEGLATTSILAVKANKFNNLIATGVRI